MGAYMSKPVVDKFEQEGVWYGDLRFGVSSMQGWRKKMEDAHFVTPLEGCAIFGVFDGHCGKKVAQFCAAHFAEELQANERFRAGDFQRALEQTFLRMDDILESLKESPDLMEADDNDQTTPAAPPDVHSPTGEGQDSPPPPPEEEESEQMRITRALAKKDGDTSISTTTLLSLWQQLMVARGRAENGGNFQACTLPDHPIRSGCTANVAIVTGSHVIVANAGDTRAILVRDGVAIDLSVDHKPLQEREKLRIEAAGGFIRMSNGHARVNGNLNLSRSIGDLKYKQNKDVPQERQIITAQPDVTITERTKLDQYVVIACDGIWDCRSSQDVADFVLAQARDGVPPSKIASNLFDEIIAPDPKDTQGIGADNMTCVIVEL